MRNVASIEDPVAIVKIFAHPDDNASLIATTLLRECRALPPAVLLVDIMPIQFTFFAASDHAAGLLAILRYNSACQRAESEKFTTIGSRSWW